MLFSSIPFQFKTAYGYDRDKYIVTEVAIGRSMIAKVYYRYVFINKRRLLEGAPVVIGYGINQYEQLNPKINTDALLYFEFTRPEDWEKLINIKYIIVGNATVEIGDQGAMPQLPITPRVKQDESLHLKGTRFELIDDGAVTSQVWDRPIV